MKTENNELEKILSMIKTGYENKQLSGDDLQMIATQTLLLQDNLANPFFKNILPRDEEIPVKEGKRRIIEFKVSTLGHYSVTQLLAKDVILEYYNSKEDLPIYFDISSTGNLCFSIGQPSTTFKNSQIWRDFNDYCRAKNPRQHGCPEKITVSYFRDLNPIKKLIDSNTNLEFELTTAINLSGHEHYDGRTTVVLNIKDSNGNVISSFDTFQLSPP